MVERPSPRSCGKTKHIQCLRFWPDCSSAKAVANTGACAVTNCSRSKAAAAGMSVLLGATPPGRTLDVPGGELDPGRRVIACPVAPSDGRAAALPLRRIRSKAIRLKDFPRVFLGHGHRRQGDGFRDLLAVQELDRLPQAFGARGGVEEGRRQFALLDPGDALVGQGVDPQKQDVLLAAGVLG